MPPERRLTAAIIQHPCTSFTTLPPTLRFTLRFTGPANLCPIAFNAFGGIRVVDVDGEFIVDTGHIVAFESSLSFKVKTFGGGWKQFLFGGEGLICTFSGKGRLWLQTRNPQEFGKTIGPKLPMREH